MTTTSTPHSTPSPRWKGRIEARHSAMHAPRVKLVPVQGGDAEISPTHKGLIMTGDELAAGVVAEPGVTEQFAAARTYIGAAKLQMSAAAAFVILAGLEIKRLRKLYAPGRWKNHVPALKRDDGKIVPAREQFSWEELLKRELGISKVTAWRYEKMAEAAKKRVADLNASELLNTPLSQLPDARRKKIVAAVQKVTDGQTAQQLMWDWGIAKKPQGSGAKGGAREGTHPVRTPQEQEEQEEHFMAALKEDWAAIESRVNLQVFTLKSWAHLPDDTRAMMKDLFQRAADEIPAVLPKGPAQPKTLALTK